jgi:phytol kinase
MNPAMGILAFFAALTLILGLVQWLARFPRFHGEIRRKIVHICMGLLTLSFPWLFKSDKPVWILALIATVLLIFMRTFALLRNTLGKALHDVQRKSYGEICFPWAIASVFWLSRGDPVSYGIPVLLLTLADAAGSLTGGRYGTAKYEVGEGISKSVEGSVAVFGVAFLCAHVPLLLMTDLGRAECLVASLTLALLVMLVESISTRGFDNLLIPLGAYFLLATYQEMELGVLAGRLVAGFGLLIFALSTRKLTSLSSSAVVGSVLLGYGGWSLGGAAFLVPLLGFYLRHFMANWLHPHWREMKHGIITIVAITSSTLPWLGWAYLHQKNFLWPFILAVSLHSAINYSGGLLSDGRRLSLTSSLCCVGIALVFSLLPTGFVVGWQQPWHQVLVIFVPSMLITVLLAPRILPMSGQTYSLADGRFFIQAILVFIVSLVGLLV